MGGLKQTAEELPEESVAGMDAGFGLWAPLESVDGIGRRKGSVRLGLWGPRAMSVDGSNIPERFADEENATLLAVIRSYRQNEHMMAQLRQMRSASSDSGGGIAN